MPREIRLFLLTVACAGILTIGLQAKEQRGRRLRLLHPAPLPWRHRSRSRSASGRDHSASRRSPAAASCSDRRRKRRVPSRLAAPRFTKKRSGGAEGEDEPTTAAVELRCDLEARDRGHDQEIAALTTLRAGLKGGEAPAGCE